jgi:N-methylhydantoinase A
MVPLPEGPLDEASLVAVAESFHRLHEARYGWAARERTVEFLHWRVTGTGLIETREELGLDELEAVPADVARTGSRSAWFDELGGFVETPAFAANRFPRGGELRGPAVVDSETTTIVVFPGQRLLADGLGTFLLEAP